MHKSKLVMTRELHGDRCLTPLPPRKIYSCPRPQSVPAPFAAFCPHPRPVTAESCKQEHPIPRRGEDDGYILTLCPYVLIFYLDLCKQFLLSAICA